MKNVLITGASSFIGGSIKSYLKEEYTLLTPTHTELDLTIYNDVEYYLNNNNIDVIIHCAAHKGYEATPGYIKDDLAMLGHLIVNFNKKIIVMNSGSIYNNPLVDEINKSRFLLSRLCQGSNIIELRLFGVYGPGEPGWRFPSYCFKCILKGEPIVIKNNRIMSWIYIDDLCEIVKDFIGNQITTGYYNISNEDKDMVEVAHLCMKVTNKKVSILSGRRGKDYYNKEPKTWDWHFTPMEEGLKGVLQSL